MKYAFPGPQRQHDRQLIPKMSKIFDAVVLVTETVIQYDTCMRASEVC